MKVELKVRADGALTPIYAINAVDQYLHWYCEKRIKLSLGGMSPLEYRQSKGIRTPNLSVNVNEFLYH